MSYHQNRFGHNNRVGRGGGRGRGHNRHIRDRIQSEICTFFLQDRCTKENCRNPHFVRQLGIAHGHQGIVKDVVMWESKRQVFTCSSDGTIRLWDCSTWKEVIQIPVCNIALDLVPEQKEKVFLNYLDMKFKVV
jgi:WD40 repeat protein